MTIDLQVLSHFVLWALVILNTIVSIILLRTFGAFYLGSRDGISRDGLELSTQAPDFEGDRMDGSRLRLSDIEAEWVVLLFATPSCGDCYDLIPPMESLQREVGDRLRILYLFRGSAQEARAIERLRRATITVLIVGRDELAAAYRVRVSPFAQVLDGDRVVRAKGLVNHRGNVEHMLGEGGLRHPALSHHRHDHQVTGVEA